MSVLFFFLFHLLVARADEHDHVYKPGEQVVLWMNTVGPRSNQQETYPYFSLPFCKGPKVAIEHAHETLGEALLGVELEYSGIDIRFKVDVPKTVVCHVTVDAAVYQRFRSATLDKYWYQMYLDNLPIWSIVGEVPRDNQSYIWTHKEFNIGYNNNQIVKVTMISSELVPVKLNEKIAFTYSVRWIASTIPFDKRFDEYLDRKFFEHKIHWFSIFNSFMMVLFLVALVFTILMRTLKRDYARYNKENRMELDSELGDEYGWKQVHGEVFRSPACASLLASVVGSGSHVAVVAILVLILAVANQLYTERGGLISTIIFIFAISSPVNGFIGGCLYAQISGKRWIRQFLLGSTLLPFLVGATAFFVNLIAVYYQTSRAISFFTMLAVLSILFFVIVPLNLIGTVMGRNLCGLAEYPCRVKPVPRPIPEKQWFMESWILILAAGILPFGSIFIELYFIFTSFWAYKIYFVFGFALLVLLLLVTVTSSVTILGTYFLLNSEDYRWQWTSFLSGASISIYAYAYATYYFFFKTKMSGIFQTTFFFSYMALFSLCLGIMCGAVGYLAARSFVRKIYSTLKVE